MVAVPDLVQPAEQQVAKLTVAQPGLVMERAKGPGPVKERAKERPRRLESRVKPGPVRGPPGFGRGSFQAWRELSGHFRGFSPGVVAGIYAGPVFPRRTYDRRPCCGGFSGPVAGSAGLYL